MKPIQVFTSLLAVAAIGMTGWSMKINSDINTTRVLQRHRKLETKMCASKRVGSLFHFTGKNTDFTATWDCDAQEYRVYKSGKLLRVAYRFGEIKSYLD